ncbi:DNA-binding HxlR family transcriptional regulator [Sphingomonas jejuensis]|uniref:DNA-binding HxlR family transcriptional regulator n=1 Tax=Sphingomonas jejuensis TaxID=904715 RepID=A0ABX0XMU3_9SPHN|nr:helix-turn-helix domain-containing protein [Sphingomonas jejuensis]NJC34560.1 DNA-binding HxlR family transcriptional regulator [Sphingomonas jejuensis]
MKLENVTELSRSRVRQGYDDACGTALALDFIGERWSLLVMRELVYGPRRFGEIRANLPGISANVLTQRLEKLAETGIIVRRMLPSPANVQVYALTPWGLQAAPLMRDLGRWAAQSRRHDPLLFMSPASAMMSLETLVDPAKLADMPPTSIAFRFPDDAFVLRTDAGSLVIRREEGAATDVVLTGTTMAMRVSIYGKLPLDADGTGGGMAVAGDMDRARRFVDLFRLPEKID